MNHRFFSTANTRGKSGRASRAGSLFYSGAQGTFTPVFNGSRTDDGDERPQALEDAAAANASGEPETRSYKGATYVRGADGLWHLQQTPAVVPTGEAPDAAGTPPALLVNGAAPTAPSAPAGSSVLGHDAGREPELEPRPEEAPAMASADTVDIEHAQLEAEGSAGHSSRPGEAEARAYKCITYEKGGDGQWRMNKKIQTIVPVEETPVAAGSKPAQVVNGAARGAREVAAEPAPASAAHAPAAELKEMPASAAANRPDEPETRVFKGLTYVKGADGQWHQMKAQAAAPIEETPAATLPPQAPLVNGAAPNAPEFSAAPAQAGAAPAQASAPAAEAVSAPKEIPAQAPVNAASHTGLGDAKREALEYPAAANPKAGPEIRTLKGANYVKGMDGQWHLLTAQAAAPIEAMPAFETPAPAAKVNGDARGVPEIPVVAAPATAAPAQAATPAPDIVLEDPKMAPVNASEDAGIGDAKPKVLEDAASRQAEPETRTLKGALYTKGADGQWHLLMAAQTTAPVETAQADAVPAQQDAEKPSFVTGQDFSHSVSAVESTQISASAGYISGNLAEFRPFSEAAQAQTPEPAPAVISAALGAAKLPAEPEPASTAPAPAPAQMPTPEVAPVPSQAPAKADVSEAKPAGLADANREALDRAFSQPDEPETRNLKSATNVMGEDGQRRAQEAQIAVPIFEPAIVSEPAAAAKMSDAVSSAKDIPADPAPAVAAPVQAQNPAPEPAPALKEAPVNAAPQTRTYNGATYVKGEDGQWHLQKAPAAVPAEETPAAAEPAHAPRVYVPAPSGKGLIVEPEPALAVPIQAEAPAPEPEPAPRKVAAKPPAGPAPLAVPVSTGGGDERSQAEALARRYHAEFVDLKNFKIQHDLLRTVPVELMFRYNFVPIEQHAEALVIAVSDPSRLMVLDEIAGLLGQRIVARVATLSQITDLLKKTEQSQRVLDEASEGLTFDVLTGDENSDENISIEKLTSDEDISPIIRLVDTTIFTALERRASDIHFETNDDSVNVKYRIDGVLQPAMAPIAREHHTTILSRIKIMSELDIAERRVPQDGRFRVRYKTRLIDFRVSIMPTVHGENAVLRVLDKESMSEKFTNLTLDVVGFAEDDLRRFRRYIREPYGMVLVTGPTGSGKTTTLYAALNEIKSDEDKIITIEDPVEYQIRGITQIPVNEKKGLTFARGLRSILRHDPDKILVGEIRDQETAQIAINSALTGHLVFTTVHANNVVDVLGRFLNMGVEAYNFVSALNCILAQRLVRTICQHCARPIEVSDQELVASGMNPDEWRDVVFREGAGCIECGGTGYRGRTAIHELLDLTDPIRELILEKKPASEVRKLARKEGMSFLRDSALDRVRKGLTTLKEINKVTFIEEDGVEKPFAATTPSAGSAAAVVAQAEAESESSPALAESDLEIPAEAVAIEVVKTASRPLPAARPNKPAGNVTYIGDKRARPLAASAARKPAKVAFIKDGKKKVQPIPAPRPRRSTK